MAEIKSNVRSWIEKNFYKSITSTFSQHQNELNEGMNSFSFQFPIQNDCNFIAWIKENTEPNEEKQKNILKSEFRLKFDNSL